ncbi:MAG: LLM class flavin-dependent oxidoreductase [Afipia sp.]|nr:LLM class flavin-dependent oxidoreductase [Afipia sp.]
MSVESARRGRVAMHNNNKLKLGLFGSNCSSGRFVTAVPERWSGTWDDNLRLARMADGYGLDFLLPVARWRAYGDQGDYQASTLETLTWAAGLLAATEHITVFGTVHAPLFNPILAAKHEFRMFGVSQREHQGRYEYAQEWIDAVKKIWSPTEIFDFDGTFVKLAGVRSHPKPFEHTFPVIMNAGQSDVGRNFAARNCDAFFNVAGTTIEEQAEAVQVAKRDAQAIGKALDVYTIGVACCRRTQKEAEEYYHYAMVENADWVSVEEILATRNITRASMTPEQFEAVRHEYTKGLGGWQLVGSPDRVAAELGRLASAGLSGIGMSIVNYAEELPFFCEEVLPRLEKMGLREKFRSEQS